MLRTLATIVAALTATTAHAGRPMATEDAGVLERGACELESFAAHLSDGGASSVRGLSVQVGCGMGLASQVALATARATSAGATDRTFTLLGKTALNHPGDGEAAFTLAWGATWLRPDAGTGRHENTWLNGVMTRPLPSFSAGLKLHANLGWSRSESARASTTNWALGLEQSYAAGIDATAEAFATDRDRSPWVQLGVRWAAIPDLLYLDGSWGVQTSSTRPKLLTMGLKFAF